MTPQNLVHNPMVRTLSWEVGDVGVTPSPPCAPTTRLFVRTMSTAFPTLESKCKLLHFVLYYKALVMSSKCSQTGVSGRVQHHSVASRYLIQIAADPYLFVF